MKDISTGKAFAFLREKARGFAVCRSGSLATYGALSAIPLLVAAGVSIDYADGLRKKSELQALVDGAVLAGAASGEDPAGAAKAFFLRTAGIPDDELAKMDFQAKVSFTFENDTISGAVTRTFPRPFGFSLTSSTYDVSAEAEVRLRGKAAQGPCITVLANSGQALLLNSGAKVDAPDCEIHVHSTKDPAFIMNAGVDLKIARLCVKGNKYIKNGGYVTKLETNCKVADDPYAGLIPEPVVPTNCQTSGAKDGNSHTLNPGAHCWVNFNGSPTITFKPGLHIIRGSMNINSGSTVIAEGVTFYFPTRDSKIQANGSLKMTATAPTSGAYKDILMFEKTSDAASNPWTQQYVFNGSVGERLEGIIHLPYRDVTYNSTTNIGSNNISMVVNTMIINSANWNFAGVTTSGGKATDFYLSK